MRIIKTKYTTKHVRGSNYLIVITTDILSSYLGILNKSLHKLRWRGKLDLDNDVWSNFWNLVRFLENRGLRPIPPDTKEK